MKNLIHTILTVCMIVSLVSFALARGAPTEQNTFTVDAAVSADVAPVVANVPPMTVGFDVICNLSEDAVIRAGNANQYSTDTSEQGSRSTTVAERGFTAKGFYLARSGPSPAMALLT